MSSYSESGFSWFDISSWGVEGRGWNSGLQRYYDRLPSKLQSWVDEGIWLHSRDSAGMSARFISDASEVKVRYRLYRGNLAPFADMSATASSGVDLYAQQVDQPTSPWIFLGSNKPASQEVTGTIVNGLSKSSRLFQLNLPLYNGVEKVEIGIPFSNSFQFVGPRQAPSIVFYGTSITQGGTSSRPGLSFPARIGRELGVPIVNLGFSGQGRFEPPLAEALAELDAAAYVLDPLPNITLDLLSRRADAFIRRLGFAHPKVPILLLGFPPPTSEETFADEAVRREELNSALAAVQEKIVASGISTVHLIPGASLLVGKEDESNDGVHPNDIGHYHYADRCTDVLRSILAQPVN